MKTWQFRIICSFLATASAGLAAALIWMLWEYIPNASIRYGILAMCAGIFLAAGFWCALQRYQIEKFADDVCETIDAAMADRRPQNFHPYEDSLTAKVQGKLMQYYDMMHEGRLQSERDKKTIQSLVSDISHQVKTPLPISGFIPGFCSTLGFRKKNADCFLTRWMRRLTSWIF